jgi:hypothetical protein
MATFRGASQPARRWRRSSLTFVEPLSSISRACERTVCRYRYSLRIHRSIFGALEFVLGPLPVVRFLLTRRLCALKRRVSLISFSWLGASVSVPIEVLLGGGRSSF